MKKTLLISLLLGIAIPALSQINGDGYYRVNNDKTGRYVYVCDNTGSINYQATTADVGAIKLLTDHDRTISDPASVIYIKLVDKNSSGTYYDLQSQGTGIHDIIGYYVNLYSSGGSIYQLYAQGKYLSDIETSVDEDNNPIQKGYLGIKNVGAAYRKWNVTPISASTAEYFGITPTIKVGEKYFQPFYADFGFSLASSGMKVWYVSQITEFGVVISEIKDKVVTANTPVIFECSSADPSDNRLELVYSHKTPISGNMLKGVYFNLNTRPDSKDARTAYDPNTMRVLGVKADGSLGFVPFVGKPDKYTKLTYLDANKSYLTVPNPSDSELPVITEAEYQAILDAGVIPHSIQGIQQVYELSGRKVGEFDRNQIEQLPAGIYIIDKRKVVVR